MSHFDKKRIALLLVFAVIAIVSIYKIISIAHEQKEAEKRQEETINEYVVKPEEVVKEETTEQPTEQANEDDSNAWYHMIEVDLESLQSVNKDVIGWIYFENEESISYPLLYSGDDEEYLRKAYTGEKLTAGSIFLEGVNKPDLNDAHSIIYGHNMRNLSMFGKLKYFKSEPGYYEEHRYFQIITKDKLYRYQIFAYEDNEQLTGGVYCVYHKPLDDFYEFLENTICKRSLVDCDINVRDYDHVVTLSTCSTAGKKYRFSLSAVRVEEHDRVPDDTRGE